jgi:hypothetical protein
MLETDMTEGISGTLVLKDVGAKALEFLLDFAYTGKLGSLSGLDIDVLAEITNASSKVGNNSS